MAAVSNVSLVRTLVMLRCTRDTVQNHTALLGRHGATVSMVGNVGACGTGKTTEGPLGDLGCRPNEWVYCTDCKVILFCV